MSGYNVCILGTGPVGKAVAERLNRSDLNIDTLYLYNRTIPKAVSLEDVLKRDSKLGEVRAVKSEEEFEELLLQNGIDINIVAIGSGVQRRDRLELLTPDFIKGIDHYAGKFYANSYSGNTIVISNPLDITTYMWAAYSEQCPQTIVGLSSLDTIRAREIVAAQINAIFADYGEELNIKPKDLDLFCIGSHDELVVPDMGKTKIGGLAWQPVLMPRDFYRLAREAIDNKAYQNFVNLGGTGIEVAQAAETMLYHLTEDTGELMAGSVYHPEKGIFIGDTFRFRKRVVELAPRSLDEATRGLFDESCEKVADVIGRLKSGDLRDINGGVLRIRGHIKLSKIPELEVKVSERPVALDLEGGLEQQYSTVVASYKGEIIEGPKRVREYSPNQDEWVWHSGTFCTKVCEVIKPNFEEVGIGEMFGFVVYVNPKAPGKFLGMRFYRESEDTLFSVRQTNDADYTRRYADKFGIGGIK